jgi:hypothetical protein
MEPMQSRRNYYFAMHQVRRFIPGAKVSGMLLVFTTGALVFTYGVNPLVKVSYATRGLISLIWFWNVFVFTICGVMILAAWLIDRYGDPPKERPAKRHR